MFESSGEITPPWGTPVTVSRRPLVHHPCLEPQTQQLEHPPIRDPLRHQPQQLLLINRAEIVPNVGLCDPHPPGKEDPDALKACSADRLGRKPYETSKKSASKIGSSTRRAAC